MGLSPAGGAGAAGPGAAAVAVGEDSALGGGEQALFAADVEDLGFAVDDEGQDLGVAGDAAGGGGGDGSAEVEGGVLDGLGEGVVVQHHRDVGDVSADGGSVAGVEVPAERGEVRLGEAQRG